MEIFVILSLAFLIATFFTIYHRPLLKHSQELGSFFILRKIAQRIRRKWSLRDYVILAPRLSIPALVLIFFLMQKSDISRQREIDTLFSKSGSDISQKLNTEKKDGKKVTGRLESLGEGRIQTTYPTSLDEYDLDKKIFTILQKYNHNNKIRLLLNPANNSMLNNIFSSEKINWIIPASYRQKEFMNFINTNLKIIRITTVFSSDQKSEEKFGGQFEKDKKLTIKQQNNQTDKHFVNIGNERILIKNIYRIEYDRKKCRSLLLSNKNFPILISCREKNKEFILQSVGLSPYWGDLGLSALMPDILQEYSQTDLDKIATASNNGTNENKSRIRDFFRENTTSYDNQNFSTHRPKKSQRQSVQPDSKEKNRFNTATKKTVKLESLSVSTMLYVVLIIFVSEGILFNLLRKKKNTVLLWLIFLSVLFIGISPGHNAYSFQFQEIYFKKNTDMQKSLSVLRRELSKRTSIQSDNQYYRPLSFTAFAQNFDSIQPYLFISGCNLKDNIADPDISILNEFMLRGGMIYFESCHAHTQASNATAALNAIESINSYQKLLNRIEKKFIRKLLSLQEDSKKNRLLMIKKNHAFYKSFYLLDYKPLFIIRLSQSTERAAFMLSHYPLSRSLTNGNENGIRFGINLIMYMLAGNYKSDQVHTRQILRRIKQRELLR